MGRTVRVKCFKTSVSDVCRGGWTEGGETGEEALSVVTIAVLRASNLLANVSSE